MTVESFGWQLRKNPRFNLECPVHIKVDSEAPVNEVEAITKNVSIGGLLVNTASLIPQHATVTFEISISTRKAVRPIRLAGKGKVVRVQRNAADATFLIAVQCDAPITQVE